MIVTIAGRLRVYPPLQNSRLDSSLRVAAFPTPFVLELCACIKTNAVATDHLERLTNMRVLQRPATTPASQLRPEP